MPSQYIVMLPFPAQGHLVPFVSLAKLIEQRTDHTITINILTTQHNLKTLHSSLPHNTSIRLLSLPFNPSDHGLPPHAQNTDSLPSALIINFMLASQSLQPSFEHFITHLSQSQGPPLCIIADIFFGWTVDVARKLGIFHSVFTTCGGYGTAAYFSLWLHLPHTKTDAEDFPLPGWPDSILFHRTQMSWYMRAADGKDPWSAFFSRQISLSLKSDGMLCHTVEEMEPNGVEILRKLTGVPVWCVGPLLPPSLLNPSSASRTVFYQSRSGKKLGISADLCTEWLNLRRPSSVLYVSFGSQNTISESQMMELARGLEASGQDFIWVIRPPIGFDINGEIMPEWLPEGFEERVSKEKKQGLMVRGWAPQVDILAHGSTGAFLSHCGWNSVQESLSQGVPLIGWPLASEQFYNAKMLEEEMGVCVEVARGSGSEVSGETVRRVIETVMGETKKGEELRRKAMEAREILRAAMREGGSSIAAVDDFMKAAVAGTL